MKLTLTMLEREGEEEEEEEEEGGFSRSGIGPLWDWVRVLN